MTQDLSQFGLQRVGSGLGSVSASSGTFSPDTTQGPNLNPYIDPGPWGFVLLGGMVLPGVVTEIDGAEKPEEWAVQKGTGSSGATTVWKGTKIAEAIKITLAAVSAEVFDNLYLMRDMLRPKLGKKPPSLILANAIVNFNGIINVALVNVGQPKWEKSGGYWSVEVTLTEYNPSKATNTGPADGSKYKNSVPTENDKLESELKSAMDDLKKS
jgi:hypothetical protein